MSPSSPILDEGVNVDPDNLPSGEEKRHQVWSLFDTIAPRYDLVNRIMSFGLDVRWRKASMKKLAAPGGSVVIDLACGTGDFVARSRRPEWCLSDLISPWACSPPPHRSTTGARRHPRHAPRGRFGRWRHVRLALRNLIELPGFFDEVARAVRPGGRIAFLDASPPENPILRFGHGIYFNRIVPVIGGLLSEGRPQVSPEVGRLSAALARAAPARSGRVRRH